MKSLLPILRTKLVLLSFLFASTLIIATTVSLEIKYSNKKAVVAEKAEIKKEKKKTAKKAILNLIATQLQTDGPTLTTDAADYAPGTIAKLTGTGFLPNEMVRVQVLHADYVEGEFIGEDHESWEIQAGPDGSFVTEWHVCEDDCVGETLRATADGLDPNPDIAPRHAEVLFTDSPQITGVFVSLQTPNPVTAGNDATYTVTIERQNSNDNFDAELTMSLPSGITATFLDGDLVIQAGDIVTIPGSQSQGTSSFTVGLKLSSDACNSFESPINFTVTATKQNGQSEVGNDNESGDGVLNIINDNAAPIIIPTGADLSLGCNPSSSDINAALGTATATDACASPTVTSDDDAVVSIGCGRSKTRTFTARDGVGNTSTAARTATWTEDTEKPFITLETAPSLVSCNPSASDITAALGTATATDACSTPTVTHIDGDVQSNSCGRSQTRTFTARDECGNTSTTSRIVTWMADNIPPLISANGTTVTLGCNPLSSDINGALGTASATDVCGNFTITPSDGTVLTTSCSRSQTRTFTVSDGCGNTNSTTRTVTWTYDKTPPGFTTTFTAVALGCNPVASDIAGALGSAAATDACGTATVTSPPDGSVTSNGCSRSKKRIFIATDGCNNTATACRTVTWTEDNTPPTFTSTFTTVTLGCNPVASDITYALGSAAATDACGTATVTSPADGSVTSNGCSRSKKRIFIATDGCNNTATACRTVTWTEDITPPTLCLTSAPALPTTCSPSATDISASLGTATATDACSTPTVTACDGSVQSSSSSCSRSQTRTFTARDVCGNTSTTSRTVTWTVDAEGPNITNVAADKTSLWPPNHKMVDITLGGATDNCGVLTYQIFNVTSNEPVNTIGDGNTDPDWIIGEGAHLQLRAERSGVNVVAPETGRIYTIYFGVTDGCSNSATSTCQVTVAHNITNPNPGNAFPINTTVNFAGTFWDIPGNKHTAKWLIDATSLNGTVTTEPSGNKMGKVAGSFKPTAAGVYKLRMNVTDQKGVTSYATTNGDYEAYFVAYDPRGGFTYGGGQFISPAGALTAKPTLSEMVKFGFTSNYYKNATYPKGETELDFKLTSDGYSFAFNALNYEYLMVNGSKAQYKGSGKTIINGVEQGGNAFILTVIDGKNATNPTGVDQIRLKIYNKNTGAVIYDNQMGASETADPTTAVDSPKADGTDIVVVSSTTAVSADITQNVQMEITPELTKFNVHVSPNPSEHQFTLYLEGGNNEKVQLVVYDAIGRQVKKIVKGDGSGAISFGENLKVGIYIVEVRQGANRKTLKLIKQ